MPSFGLVKDQRLEKRVHGPRHAKVYHHPPRDRPHRQPPYHRTPRYPPHRPPGYPHQPPGYPQTATKMGDNPAVNPMLPRAGEDTKPAYHSRNPYQTLVQPMPNSRKVESRLSASSVSYHDPEMEIQRLRLWIILECAAGFISVICAALLVPFGAEHSDVIHSISFMFGLMYITTGISTSLCMRWKSAVSMRICLGVNVFGAILAIVGIVLGVLSTFGLFEGQGAEQRFEMPEEHYDIATHALTAAAMLAAILEIVPTTYIVYSIVKAWKMRADEMALPVNV